MHSSGPFLCTLVDLLFCAFFCSVHSNGPFGGPFFVCGVGGGGGGGVPQNPEKPPGYGLGYS